ncbi:MAG: response regulator [Pseudomonadota bacterium]|jgi:Signal transduction histidine kinase|nr:MAG: hybrid sensor histidine kinase/response regulator [Pseudomonadota bacterium]
MDQAITTNLPGQEPPRILIVDDLPEKLLVYRTLLEDLDAQIVTARSGSEALKRVLEQEFAVILLDVNMPDIDGLETAKLIRSHKRARLTPIIFITGYADEMQTMRGYELGAVDYILSPVVPEVLRTKVRVFVDLYRMRAALAHANQVLEQRVAERTAELQRSNERLQAEIAERMRAEREREALLEREKVLRAQAEELSRLKDEFLATMSHELRTPLNAIFGWITLLRSRRLDEATQARALETIERNARAQKRLIEDLLDVSRIVTGKITLELSAVNPRRIIEAALETMRPAAQAKGIKIVPLLDTGVGTLRGDFARLQQVVCNLLSNAIKFTPTGGQVEVCLAQRNGEVEISVRDNGQGIKPEFLPYVFDRFRQEDGSISRCHGGLGLGLAIVRHLVELHGGTVEAASPGVGKGATFTVRLPVRAHTAPGRTETAPTVRPSNPSLLAGLHVLVVDDDPHARELMSCILEGFGARVSLAESGAAALTQLFAHRPDALVADLGMPGMDGYALIEQIRALDPDFGGRTPAVAVTACASAQDRLRALEAGYQNHIAKPVEPEELAVVIASLTGRCVPERRAQAD